ncbi:MAG: organomercurial lyase [Trebonia sp.]
MTDPAGLRSGGSADRQATLPAPVRDLHRAVLRRFLDTGAPPTQRWIRQAAAEHGLGDPAVTELAAADLVHIAGRVVTVAYPFSGKPTRQRVMLDGYPGVHSMCAIDALGIPAMTGRDGRITATDPHDGTPIEVAARDGIWAWTPAEAVVVYGRVKDCGTGRESREVMCPNTTFHASRGSARAYLAARGDIDGQILDQRAATSLAERWFSPLLGRTSTTTTAPGPPA